MESRNNFNTGKVFVFKRWTRRKDAILISLSRIIRIGVLSFSLSIIVSTGLSFSQDKESVQTITSIDLDEVEIVSEGTPEIYSQVARNITVISATEISSLPGTSIQDILEYAGSIDLRQRNTNGVQADIHFRGGTFDQVLVLLNGMNITDPQTGHFNLDLPVDLSLVKRIEILHGSGARIYGANASKGVINIITRNDFKGLKAGIEAGQNRLFHMNGLAGISTENQNHVLGLSRNVCDGYTSNTDYRLSGFYYQGNYNTKVADIDWSGGIRLKSFGANDFYSPVFPGQYEETGTGFGSLGFRSRGKINLEGKAYVRRHNDHFLLRRNDPAFYENFHRTGVSGFRVQTWFISGAGYSYIGFERRNESILSTILGEPLNEPVKVKGENTSYQAGNKRSNNSIFFEQKFQKEGLYISGGSMLNYNRDYNKNWSLFPGLDISYRIPVLNLRIFASSGRALRLPTFTDMYYSDPANLGNPLLQPEESYSFDTGIEYAEDKLKLKMNLFSDFTGNAIDWVIEEGDSMFRAANIGQITSRGTEFSGIFTNADEQSVVSVSRISIAYSYISQDISTGDRESKYAGDFLKHKMTASIAFRFGESFRLFYNLLYQDRNGSYLDYDEKTGQRYSTSFEPYFLSDIKISCSAPGMVFHCGISNLFDTKYNDIGNLVQPGRWITGGFEFLIESSAN